MSMRSEMQHYEAFVAVVRRGNITLAAHELRQPRATVSRSLARLEADLAVALVTRTTRRVVPTAAGQRLYERVAPLLDEWTAMEQEAREDAREVRGAVRVSVLPLLAPALASVCGALAKDHPGLRIEVVANVRLVDLRSEGFDVAIWAGDVRDPDLVCRRLAVGQVGLFATPAYLSRRGVPAGPEQLAEHDLLRGHNSRNQPRTWWPLRSGGRVRVDGAFVTNDHVLLKAAALQGQGIALLAYHDVRDAVAEGRLVPVLAAEVGNTAVAWVVIAQRALIPMRLRTFLEAIYAHVHLEDGG
jgi:DNA-binding transcriptional LysR family regulator